MRIKFLNIIGIICMISYIINLIAGKSDNETFIAGICLFILACCEKIFQKVSRDR